jgi:hypothetical protein
MAKPSEPEKYLTYEMVLRGLKLSPLQVRAIFTTILQKSMPNSAEKAEPADIFCLLVADLLEQLAFLQPEQRTFLLTELKPLLGGEPVDLLHLMFVDEEYCTWTGFTGFLNLTDGAQVESLSDPPLESIGYNLTELYRRGTLMLENRNGFHVKKPDPGSVDEPGHV